MLAILAMSPGCGGVGEGGVGSPGGDGSLFVRLGGMDGVRALVDDLTGRLASDQRIQRFFVKTDFRRFKGRLVVQLCALTGGPCRYGGSMTDVHRGLNAAAGACKCTCVAEGQVCDSGTKLEFFTDMGCATPCATTSVHSCDAVSGNCGSQGSLRGAVPVATGGSCQPTVTMPTPASWQWDARICEASNARTCDDPALVCAPPPAAPYVSRLCVFSVILEAQSPPACPAEYPAAHEPLDATLSDDRGCSACACSSVSGGTCTGTTFSR